ncbi:N-acetylglucosamine-regulated outer membrane porin [Klebsiella pneumoniae subsp. ozaenae]|uniref:N-acetylglucosamine-regulated outer membrane porin n=1 Tax=Klebsiella pneumoniae subsp. ozaenae TaxID=574 RepID=A0A377Z804_KLEPO|nr:N-acetylglucosamine-regulated outer membrane porin [Klebsiella pneumoniae subsp. ozaenae]
MRTFSGKRSTLALAIAAVTAMSGWVVAPQASAAGFIDDSTLTGGIYYWQRERDRKDVTDGDKYKTNLSHSTWNANLDFQSGYAADMFGLDIAAFTAIEMAENGDSGTRTKLPSRHVTKPMTKTIPAIRAASACIKPQRNSNMVRRGHVRLYPANRPDSAGPALEFYARYLSGGGGRG